MTEEGWLTCEDPAAMLGYLRELMGHRKAILWGVACRRGVERFDIYGPTLETTDTVERWADSKASDREVQFAYDSIWQALESAGKMIMGDPDSPEPNLGTAGYFAVEAALALFGDISRHQSSVLSGDVTPYQRAASVLFACQGALRFGDFTPECLEIQEERLLHVELLRDIFGNPFRPIVVDPAWLTPTVQSIAAAIYQDRAFDRLPILADALEEAGCTNADVLLHCRQPGEHVRGCWVVDLVLGKK